MDKKQLSERDICTKFIKHLPGAPGRLGPDTNQECVPCVFIALMPSMKGTSARHE